MKKILTISALFSVVYCTAVAQSEQTIIRKGNRLYKEGQFQQALPEYQRAARQNPSNAVARYNLGSALFRNNQFAEAENEFDAAIASTTDPAMQQKAWYNKGVALSKLKKLEESIAAWKQAVKMNPADADARFNLQKALSERKRQNEGQEKKQQQQQQQKKQPQKPKQPQSKLDRRKIEQYLQSLRQKEQEVQRKIQENKTRSVNRPEKDW